MEVELLNRSDAAVYLGVSQSTLARWAVERIGPRYHKIGRRVRYRSSDLRDFVSANAVEPVAGRKRPIGFNSGH